MNSLSIGKLARSSGIGIETIRFYEREGLLDKPSRIDGGYRQYSPEVWRDFASSGTRSSWVSLCRRSGTAVIDSSAVKKLTEKKIEDIEFKIASLQRMRRVLLKLATACDCPILEALAK